MLTPVVAGGADSRDRVKKHADRTGGRVEGPRPSAPFAYTHLHQLRWVLEPAADCVLWAGCLTIATVLRYGSGAESVFTHGLAFMVGLAVVAQLVFGVLLDLYRVRWQVGSFEQIRALALTVVLTTALLSLVNVTQTRHLLPAGAVLLGGTLTLLLGGALRSGWRLNWERHLSPREGARRAVVFGAGNGGVQLVNLLLTTRDSAYIPVALLDDDPFKQRDRIRHLRVAGGRHQLEQVARHTNADTVIVAIPSATAAVVRELSDLAMGSNLDVRVLPPPSEILTPYLTASDIRPVTPADLLGRHVIHTDVEQIAGYLADRRVLVTGAGGSIGSELCRQIQRFKPAALIMLDRDESGLHDVQLSLEGRALLDSRRLVVCDIRDPDAVAAIFAEHRPEVVFHAGALKHLPLLEMWPAEAVKTNVIGTQRVIDAAVAHGVERFVNISTDKAADPTSVLGYTKRLAERLTAAGDARGAGTYLSVRFGNVLGSRGSVLTTFATQIDAGGPVTVTDPDVTRYFMTVEEAVELVVQAGAIGRGGEVLVLEMGSPVRIADVAEQLVAASKRPVRIVYTGLRPGEKKHEQLFGVGEQGRRRSHQLISHVTAPPLEPEAVEQLHAALASPRLKDLLAELSHLGTRSWQVSEATGDR